MLMDELDSGFRAIYRNHLSVDGFDITQFTTYKIVESQVISSNVVSTEVDRHVS